jgi:hypothetical protein
MGAFSLYVQYRSETEDTESAAERLERYVEEYESVEYGTERVETDPGPDVVAPDRGLDISDIDAFASIVADLRDDPAVHDMSLWGPGAQRYPVRVYHHALRSLSDPDRYQFHAVDDRETLVVCDSPADLDRAREDIGAAGLVEGGTAKF